MNDLMHRLYHIEKETSDGKETELANRGGDEFVNLKKAIARNLQTVREQIKDRDDILVSKSGKATQTYTIQLGSRIRSMIRQAKSDAQRMREIQQTQARKKSGQEGGKDYDKVQHRSEVVDIIFQHITEVEALEKRKYKKEVDDARSALLTGGSKSKSSGMPSLTRSKGGKGRPMDITTQVATDTSLPEIDVEAGLQQIKRTDQEIDQQLDLVSGHVTSLHQIAVSMQDELKVQNQMVDEITGKVDHTTSHLNVLNRKMKDTLVKAKSASNLIIYFILIVVILGIGAFIVNSARKA